MQRWIGVLLTAAVTWTGLQATARAADGQMEARITHDPLTVLAPASGTPEQTVTWEGTFWFDGWAGTEARNAVGTFRLPAGVTVESVTADDECVLQERTVTCTYPTLTESDYKRVTVRAKVTSGQVGERLGATLVATADNASRNPGGPADDIGPLIVDDSADLRVERGGWQPTVSPGGEVNYTFYASNAGPHLSAPAKLVVRPDERLTEVRVRPDSGGVAPCTPVGNAYECALERWSGFTMTAKAPDLDGHELLSTITAQFAEGAATTDPRPGDNTLTLETRIERQTELATELTLTPSSIPATSLKDEPTLTFHATVTNRGTAPARDAEAGVYLPDGLRLLTGGLPPSCTGETGLTCRFGELPAGATRSMTFQAKATSAIRSSWMSASIEARAANAASAGASAVLTVTGYSADLSVTAPTLPAQIAEGEPVTVRFPAVNMGPFTPVNATVRVELDGVSGDPVLSVGGAGGTCRLSTYGGVSRGFLCDLPGLDGRPREITVTATPTLFAGDRFEIAGSIRATDNHPSDPVWQNSEFTRSTTIVPAAEARPDLVLAVQNPPSGVIPGKSVAYPLTIANTGSGRAVGTRISAPLPKGLSSLSAPGCSFENSLLTCPVGVLAVGGTRRITVTGSVRPDATGQIAATFTAASTNTDPSRDDNTVSIRSTAEPGVDVRVTGKVGALRKGRRAVYVLTVTNAGPSTARSLTVNGRLPAGLKFVSVQGCKRQANGISCKRDRLAPGQTLEIRVAVLVTSSAKGTKAFKVVTRTTTPDRAPGNNAVTIRKNVARA